MTTEDEMYELALADKFADAIEPRCYSDHNEDIRTKGDCDYCGGTKPQ